MALLSKEGISEAIRAGDILQLKRELDNPYDHLAVSVHHQGVKLGYIPRNNNTVIAWLLDQQAPLAAVIKSKHPGGDPRNWVTVRVVMEG